MLLINPVVIYTLVWLFSLFLYSLHYSYVLSPLAPSAIHYVFLSILSIFLSWLVISLVMRKKNESVEGDPTRQKLTDSNILKIKSILLVWALGTLFSLFYFHDLPILAIFGLGHMTYAQYGIPSLQGFLNAIHESLNMYAVYLFIKERRLKYIFYLVLLYTPVILYMNRGMLTSMLVESMFVFLVFGKVQFRDVVKLVIFSIFFMFAFCLLGDLRFLGASSHLHSIYHNFFQISESYPSWMPKSFLWFYTYMTTPLMNTFYNINAAANFLFHPYYILYGMLPTVIRSSIAAPEAAHLVDKGFNSASFISNYLPAYGYYGSLLFYFLAAFFPLYFYKMFKKRSELLYGFVLVIFLHSISLSIFSDFFTKDVYLFQIIIQYFVFSLFFTVRSPVAIPYCKRTVSL